MSNVNEIAEVKIREAKVKVGINNVNLPSVYLAEVCPEVTAYLIQLPILYIVVYRGSLVVTM